MAYHIEKNVAGNPEIVIDGWNEGIASSALTGLQDVRGVNISDIPGTFLIQSAITSTAPDVNFPNDFSGFSLPFTANPATDSIDFSPATHLNSPSTYIAVTFSTTGSLPAPFVAGTIYFLNFITQNTFNVYSSYSDIFLGSPIDITTTGTGVQTATSINMGTMTSATTSPDGSLATVDSNGRVWFLNDIGWVLLNGNTLTNASGNGIIVYNAWLFVFRNRSIDVYGPLDPTVANGEFGFGTWYNGWQSMNQSAGDATRHDLFVGENNILYWTDYDSTSSFNTRGYLGSLNPVAGQLLFQDTGNPTTSNATTNYTYNNQALDFPVYERPTAIEELGSQLVIGVNILAGQIQGYSKVYTWDTVSPSFNLPLFLPDDSITEMINYNNVIYIFAGIRGRIFRTNLSTIEFAQKIPDTMYIPSTTSGIEGNPLSPAGNGGNSSTFTFSNNATVLRNKIYFGVGNVTGGSALYSYDAQANVLKIEGQGSVGNYGAAFAPLIVPCVVAPFEAGIIYYSWTNNTVSGWDQFNIYAINKTTFSGYITTDMIPVATKLYSKTFTEVEWKLTTPLGPSDQVRISFREANNIPFTIVGTTQYSSTLPPQVSDIYTANITNAEWVQFKIELSSLNSGGATGVLFKELRLR